MHARKGSGLPCTTRITCTAVRTQSITLAMTLHHGCVHVCVSTPQAIRLYSACRSWMHAGCDARPEVDALAVLQMLEQHQLVHEACSCNCQQTAKQLHMDPDAAAWRLFLHKLLAVAARQAPITHKPHTLPYAGPQVKSCKALARTLLQYNCAKATIPPAMIASTTNGTARGLNHKPQLPSLQRASAYICTIHPLTRTPQGETAYATSSSQSAPSVTAAPFWHRPLSVQHTFLQAGKINVGEQLPALSQQSTGI